MNKWTIVFIELGMIAGIIAAGYTLPGTIPLATFLSASGVCFAVGNFFLVKKVQETKSGGTSSKTGPWLHLIRVFGILAAVWLIGKLFFKQ
jgi:membrane associated rhomboid family serine protease